MSHGHRHVASSYREAALDLHNVWLPSPHWPLAALLAVVAVVVSRKMVISTTYSCAISSSASDVDRLLLEVVAELSGTSVTFSTPATTTDVDEEASPSKVVTAVGTLTNAFTGRSNQIALVGVESILRKWFGETLGSAQEEEVVSSWIYAVETSVLIPLRHGDEGEHCTSRNNSVLFSIAQSLTVSTFHFP
jgi:hypothetical protein